MSVDVSTRDYLQALYGRCTHGQIVFVKSCRNKVSKTFDVDQILLAAAHVARNPNDLFIKVNPMDFDAVKARNPYGIGGTAEVVAIVGFHLDVDAAKNDKYLSQEKMLEALDSMPLAPSAIILTNGDTGGFHAYWWLHDPLYIETEDQRADCQSISNRWLEELREHAKPGTIDGTANIDRILRPIGSIRPKTGNRVKALRWDPEQRYDLDQFRLPEISKPAAQATHEPRHDGESVVQKYLDAVGENHPATLLEKYAGYTRQHGDFYIRPGSESGAPTGEVFTLPDGRIGFTFKSGACDPFTSTNRNGTNGRWYSPEAIYVTLVHNGDWKAAAKHCYEFLEPSKSPVNQAGLDSQPHGLATVADTATPGTLTIDDERTVRGGAILTQLINDLRSGDVPQLIDMGPALNGMEIAQGLITIIGAGPGTGKTALVMQCVFAALERDPNLRAVIANAEMTFSVLLRRQLTKMTRIASEKIRFAQLDEEELARITAAAGELLPRLDRVRVMEDDYSVAGLLGFANEPPGILVVDYLQKFAPADAEPRIGVGQVMNALRTLAKWGWSIIAISATSRPQKGQKRLTMSSLRESSEIEFNADSIYMMNDDGSVYDCDYIRKITLDHAKNRHGSQVDIELVFHKPRMEFSATESEPLGLAEFGAVVDVDDPFYEEAS